MGSLIARWSAREPAAVKNGRHDQVVRRRGLRAAGAPGRTAGPLDGLADRLHEVRAATCGALDGRALRFLDSIRFASATTASWSRTCASPATRWPGSTRPRIHASCRSRSGGARSATRSRPRSAQRWRTGAGGRDRGDGGFLYAAASSRPSRRSGSRCYARDRRRRRLRDAALRPGRDGRGPLRVDLVTPDFCALARAFGSARQVDGSTTTSARRWPPTSSNDEPSVLVASTPSRSYPRRHVAELVPAHNGA